MCVWGGGGGGGKGRKIYFTSEHESHNWYETAY